MERYTEYDKLKKILDESWKSHYEEYVKRFPDIKEFYTTLLAAMSRGNFNSVSRIYRTDFQEGKLNFSEMLRKAYGFSAEPDVNDSGLNNPSNIDMINEVAYNFKKQNENIFQISTNLIDDRLNSVPENRKSELLNKIINKDYSFKLPFWAGIRARQRSQAW